MRISLIVVLLASAAAGGRQAATAPRQMSRHQTASRAQAPDARKLLVPLVFTENAGQTDPQVKFVARTRDYSLFLTAHEAVLAHASSAIRLRFSGANSKTRVTPVDRQPGAVNYLVGTDESRWRRGIATYAKVRYESLYPGVDLVFYGNDRQLEYDLVVSPGADTQKIRLAVTGAETLTASDDGDLVARAGEGEIRLRRPTIYQEKVEGSSAQVPVEGKYRLTETGDVAFDLGDYDRTRPLVIDPVVVYATYLSGDSTDQQGTGSVGQSLAVDATGAAYVTGYTDASDFPTTAGSLQPQHILNGGSPNAPCVNPYLAPKYVGGFAFVSKISPDGSSLVYSTYLGGTYLLAGPREDECNGANTVGDAIAVDAAGNAYVTGATESTDFAVTPGRSSSTLFVAKLNPTGSNLVYARRVPSSINVTRSSAIALGPYGSVYLTGKTSSDFPINQCGPDFPGQPCAFQAVCRGCVASINGFSYNAFVLALDAYGYEMYGSYLGGTGNTYGTGIAVAPNGDVSVTGYTGTSNFPTTPGALRTYPGGDAGVRGGGDVFVTKLTFDLSTAIFSTYLGDDSTDMPGAVAVDGSGNTYVTGWTQSAAFPTTPGSFLPDRPGAVFPGVTHAFVTKFGPAGSLVYSTFLGGFNGTENGIAIQVDSAGRAYVAGNSDSANFPITPDATQSTPGKGFLSVLNPAGSGLVFSTFFGASSYLLVHGVAIGPDGSAYVSGTVDSHASYPFPTTPGAFQQQISPGEALEGPPDVFVTRISFGPPPDATPPTVQCAQPDGLWHANDVSIGCTANDGESGLASSSDAAFFLTTSVAAGTETDNAATWSRQVCDNANNCTTVGPIGGNKVDKKGPSVGISVPIAGVYTLGQSVMASYGCPDGGSGLGICLGPVASGSLIDTASLGVKAFAVNATDAVGNPGSASVNYTVSLGGTFSALGPTGVWIGLKNSDDVGTKFDLLVEVLKNGSVVTSGELDAVPGGSSGFNNAVLRQVGAALGAGVSYAPGDTMAVRVSVRIAVGVSGHRSGTARLWYGDGGANTRINTMVNGVSRTFYLANGAALSPTTGSGPRSTIDVFVDRAVGGNPFKPFGTWSITF